MDIKINCTVKNAQRETVKIVIDQNDIDALIVEKAKDMGITGYSGRILWHFDETVVSVVIED